jgi:MFS transporter, DHA2 family, multidrug resistance protein
VDHGQLQLTSRLIQDPPYFRRRKISETHIDYIGLSFVALGLGTLQVVLDKGQRDDWFESQFITILTMIAVASLLFVIFWEWKQKDPIIDLHLFRERNFSISNLLMFMLGFALLGSTLLLPLFMQTMLGYTAQQSGLALMPGGLAIMALLPLVGFLLSRYSPRWLLVFGLVVLAASLFHMTSFNLEIDFRTTTEARLLQAVGMAFLFVPINTAAYASLPREKNNAASGLMNLARNIGGSVGISVVTTMLDRRAQVHLTNLSQNLSAGNAAMQGMLRGAATAMQARGASASEATQQAYALIQNTVQRQATMLSYIDCFWFLGVAILCMIPAVFLMRKSKPGGGMAVH